MKTTLAFNKSTTKTTEAQSCSVSDEWSAVFAEGRRTALENGITEQDIKDAIKWAREQNQTKK